VINPRLEDIAPAPGSNTTVGHARTRAVQVQAVPADVDQLARHRIGGGIGCLTCGLVAAADRRQRQHGEQRVQQPTSGPTAQLLPGAHDHPDHHHEQSGWPDPVERVAHLGAQPDQQESAQSHQRGGRCGPALRLVGVARREHGQQRPAHGEAAQEPAGDGILLGRDERGGDEEQSGEQTGGQ
jgi:hypothetical protein